MVRGLDRFAEHFAGFEDRYALIGGTAVFVALDASGLQFRATKDLDIVICVEALDTEFAAAFWEFVEAGNYENRQKSTGKRLFYRFYGPEDESYPEMLELFSRVPEWVELDDDAHLTPIPLEAELASLSAILLDDDYYGLIMEGREVTANGLAVLPPNLLIPLKAKAWLDLTDRKRVGATVDDFDIKKHRNDVVRLTQLLVPSETVDLPASVRDHMTRFVAEALNSGAEPKVLGVAGASLEDIRTVLRSAYGLGA